MTTPEPAGVALNGPVSGALRRDATDAEPGFELRLQDTPLVVHYDSEQWRLYLEVDPTTQQLTRIPSKAEKRVAADVAKRLRDSGVTAKRALPLANEILSMIKTGAPQ